MATNLAESLTIWILAFAGVVSILEWTGFLPAKISRVLGKNRLRESMDILKEFGIDLDRHRRVNLSVITGRVFSNGDGTEEALKKDLNKFLKAGDVMVGKTETIKLHEFLDVMGATVHPQYSVLFARYLSTYWSVSLRDKDTIISPAVDFVVTPKGGSPILGYEFAKLRGLPFLLFTEDGKFVCENEDVAFHSFFDCFERPELGTIALIVDDSATGGRKVINAASTLRRFGYEVSDCLVLFEPEVKYARERLLSEKITLHSITKRP